MARLSISAFVLLVYFGAAPAAAQTESLRWARGIVTAVAPSAFTLQLRDRSMAISLDPAAPTPALTAGSIVEAHYVEKKETRTAVLILDAGAAGSSELSKSPGRSVRGVTNGTRRSTLKINVGQKSRSLDLDSKTRLVDVDGRTVATGKKAVVPLLATGESVLVKYQEDDSSFMSGDILLPGSSTTALEVRRLK